jgi:hypothetical protein
VVLEYAEATTRARRLRRRQRVGEDDGKGQSTPVPIALFIRAPLWTPVANLSP